MSPLPHSPPGASSLEESSNTIEESRGAADRDHDSSSTSTSGRQPSPPGAGAGAGGHHGGGAQPRPIFVLEGLTSLAVSVVICHTAHCLSRALGAPGQVREGGPQSASYLLPPTSKQQLQFITFVTALSVLAATLVPRLLGPLAVSAQGLAQVWTGVTGVDGCGRD